jgi:hypothetical protein
MPQNFSDSLALPLTGGGDADYPNAKERRGCATAQ